MFPIANKIWFANKSTTKYSNSNKFRKNYSKQKVYRLINPENFISIHGTNYSEQFIYSDNTKNNIEFFRFNQSKSEARTFTGDQNKANLATVNFSWFYLQRIYPEKINKTDSNITIFIISFCYRHELILKFYRKEYMTKTRFHN